MSSRSRCAKLVRTVTAIIFNSLPCAPCIAARITCGLEWTVSNFAPSDATRAAALFTVSPMSYIFRSTKTFFPIAINSRTMPGPSAVNSSNPTL